jgi:hypothetical protein
MTVGETFLIVQDASGDRFWIDDEGDLLLWDEAQPPSPPFELRQTEERLAQAPESRWKDVFLAARPLPAADWYTGNWSPGDHQGRELPDAARPPDAYGRLRRQAAVAYYFLAGYDHPATAAVRADLANALREAGAEVE